MNSTLVAPFAGTVVALPAAPGSQIAAGEPVVVVEAMKMEHEIVAGQDGVVDEVAVSIGQTVSEGDVLAVLAPGAALAETRAAGDGAAQERPDLHDVHERHLIGLDARRPDAVAKRHERGRRTAGENLDDLLDRGSFVEYGPLVFAAQERRRPREELIERTPADGLVGGVGRVDGLPVAAMSYDYTVLAGTQGMRNHQKKDRLLEIAARRRLPVVLFAEGGGGRPGDVDMPVISGLDTRAFGLFAQLSGLVPLVGIASGYCFAGNAALLGCCDVIIATEDASIGMGGPAMIEGGGLGTYPPGEVGPIDVQWGNGVVDIRVADDAGAVAAARRHLAYFSRTAAPSAPAGRADPEVLRTMIPANRMRVYDVWAVIEALLEDVLELRAGFAPGMITALARADGRPLGVADTPGFMVGPDAERTATVRHVTRMFVAGANLTVPAGTVILRKGYGLGAQAMAAGGFKAPLFTVGWPTSEFGAMGLEGAVRLGMRRELEAIEDPVEGHRAYEQMAAAAYERGRGISMASYFEIDDVIDPADTRRWIATLFDEAAPGWWETPGKRRPHVDTW